MGACTYTEMSSLLHAYELGILSEPDCEQFERHLLRCPECRNKVERFQNEIVALRDVVSDTWIDAVPVDTSYRRQPTSRIAWPVLAATLFVLLVVVLFWNPLSEPNESIREVQVIGLMQTRSGLASRYEIRPGKDILLCFSTYNATPNSIHRVVVETSDGDRICAVDRFQNYDAAGVGWLFIPSRLISPYKYTLTVIDPDIIEGNPIAHFKFELISAEEAGAVQESGGIE